MNSSLKVEIHINIDNRKYKVKATPRGLQEEDASQAWDSSGQTKTVAGSVNCRILQDTEVETH